MSVRATLRHLANRVLQPVGLHLVRRRSAFEMDDMLLGAHARGTQLATIIDIGASDGIWSRRARRHFPRANYLLFEPLAERRPALDRLEKQLGFHIVHAAAGAEEGFAEFAIDPNLDGSGVAQAGATGTRRVPVQTVDAAVRQWNLPGPYCLKLDTHGFEVPILTGANTVLQSTALLIVEAYNFSLVSGCLRFPELCAWMEARGFRCCDLADPMRRPGDGVLWQLDLAFAPAGSAIFRSNRFA